MGEIEHHKIQEYRANEFVVATPHRDLVLRHLVDVGASVRAESPQLGLTLVRLTDVPGAVERVRAERETEARRFRRDSGTDELPLDDLLNELRETFADRYGGWAPMLGKNRIMRGVQFYPYPSGGGEGDPVPVPAGRDRRRAVGGREEAGHGVRVMLLDTSILGHEHLTGRYIADQGSILRPDDRPLRCFEGHATFIAGLILQRAPSAEIEVESVLRDGPAPENAAVLGKTSVDIWDVAEQMIRCADSGADILNLSFGCFTFDHLPPLVLDRAISRLTPRMVVVAASGNYGDPRASEHVSDSEHAVVPKPNTPIWPAAFPDVVAVGATDSDGAPAAFTPKVPWIDFLAPGVKVRSTYLYGNITGRDGNLIEPTFTGRAEWSGSSFAAAAVSGAIAARTVRGKHSAFEAVDQLRKGTRGRGGADVHVANLT